MVDVLLFENLLRALKSGCRLILVGDTDQLPAVGPGSLLHDLIDSAVMPVVQLTEVFRQAMESHIVANAHRIVEGRPPELAYKTGDFFFLGRSSGREVLPDGAGSLSSSSAGQLWLFCFQRAPGALSGKKGRVGHGGAEPAGFRSC